MGRLADAQTRLTAFDGNRGRLRRPRAITEAAGDPYRIAPLVDCPAERSEVVAEAAQPTTYFRMLWPTASVNALSPKVNTPPDSVRLMTLKLTAKVSPTPTV